MSSAVPRSSSAVSFPRQASVAPAAPSSPAAPAGLNMMPRTSPARVRTHSSSMAAPAAPPPPPPSSPDGAAATAASTSQTARSSPSPGSSPMRPTTALSFTGLAIRSNTLPTRRTFSARCRGVVASPPPPEDLAADPASRASAGADDRARTRSRLEKGARRRDSSMVRNGSRSTSAPWWLGSDSADDMIINHQSLPSTM